MARPRKPTIVKEVSGTARKHRMNAAEPKPGAASFNPPEHLSDAAKEAWREISGIAEQMGVLTETDPVVLEGIAGTLADLRKARAALGRPLMVSRGGEVVQLAEGGERYYWTDGAGGPMRRTRPEVADIADADRRLLGWIQKFGLSPADRSRVSASTKPAESSPWDELKIIVGGKS